MINKHLFTLISVFLAAGFLVLYFGGLSLVPFHPDEATQLYMSSDFKTFFSNPGSLAYDPDSSEPLRQHYRLVDSPLTRYVIGAGLAIAGKEPPGTDWDWSASWGQNSDAGALPVPSTLAIARIVCSILIPVGLFAFYKAIRGYSDKWVALAGVMLLALNSLILLHTRRAMAEALLLSLFLILLWRLSKPFSVRNTIWVSILVGLLLQTKQLILPIVVASILILVWDGVKKPGWRSIPVTVLIPVAILLILFIILNPVVWRNPIQTAPMMLSQRQLVSQDQLGTFTGINSSLALTTPLSRFAAILAQTYFAGPAFFDVGNYQDPLKTGIDLYSGKFIHIFFSGWVWGAIFLVFTVLGCVLVIIQRLQHGKPVPKTVAICFWIGFWQFSASIIFLTLGFQRYYLMFIPLSLVFSLYGIQQVIGQVQSRSRKS